MSDNCIGRIGEKFKNLSALDLYSNPGVKDSGILKVLENSGHSLKRLYLQSCRQVTKNDYSNGLK